MPSLLLSRLGTKAKLARWHVALFPAVQRYVSVFGGAASEFMYREAVGMEVLNDIDSDIHNVFAVVRDPRQCARLRRLLLGTPHGRQQFVECREARDTMDPVHRAWAFLVVANTGNVRCSVRTRSWFTLTNRLYWLPSHLGWWCDPMAGYDWNACHGRTSLTVTTRTMRCCTAIPRTIRTHVSAPRNNTAMSCRHRSMSICWCGCGNARPAYCSVAIPTQPMTTCCRIGCSCRRITMPHG